MSESAERNPSLGEQETKPFKPRKYPPNETVSCVEAVKRMVENPGGSRLASALKNELSCIFDEEEIVESIKFLLRSNEYELDHGYMMLTRHKVKEVYPTTANLW